MNVWQHSKGCYRDYLGVIEESQKNHVPPAVPMHDVNSSHSGDIVLAGLWMLV